ncbi:MAG TPA: ABC transporter permease [Solirubrobacterales bacterium]
MSGAALVLHQFRFDQKVFWRNGVAVFFTAALPLIFLIGLATVFKNREISGLDVKGATYYVPAILSLAVISATMVKLGTNLPAEREAGQLKRVRGTPLPPATFIAGRVGNSLVITLIMVVLIAVIGRLLYGVHIPTHTMPAMLVTLAVGAISFSCLGFALAALIPTADAAPAVTNATVLPLYFLSGVFIPQNEIPDGVLNFADAFPIRHFFEAMFTAWDPNTTGAGFEFGHLAVVAAWGLLGLAIAIRFFRWEPRQ